MLCWWVSSLSTLIVFFLTTHLVAFASLLSAQLCIHFANEKLQQHFNTNTFKLETGLYRAEGIKIS